MSDAGKWGATSDEAHAAPQKWGNDDGQGSAWAKWEGTWQEADAAWPGCEKVEGQGIVEYIKEEGSEDEEAKEKLLEAFPSLSADAVDEETKQFIQRKWPHPGGTVFWFAVRKRVRRDGGLAPPWQGGPK